MNFAQLGLEACFATSEFVFQFVIHRQGRMTEKGAEELVCSSPAAAVVKSHELNNI